MRPRTGWSDPRFWLVAVHAAHAAALMLGRASYLGAAMLLVCLGLLARPDQRRLWGLLVALDVTFIGLAYLDAPNHHWVLTAAAMMFGALGSTSLEDRQLGARGLLVLVFALATLQKLLAPDMFGGSFFGFMWSTGELAAPLWRQVDGLRNLMIDNHDAVVALLDGGQLDATAQVRWPLGDLDRWGRATAVVTILVEAAVVAVAVWTGRGAQLQAGLLAFLVPLVILRPEWTFAGVIAVLGLAAGRQPRGRWSVALRVFVLVCAAMTVASQISASQEEQNVRRGEHQLDQREG